MYPRGHVKFARNRANMPKWTCKLCTPGGRSRKRQRVWSCRGGALGTKQGNRVDMCPQGHVMQGSNIAKIKTRTGELCTPGGRQQKIQGGWWCRSGARATDQKDRIVMCTRTNVNNSRNGEKKCKNEHSNHGEGWS